MYMNKKTILVIRKNRTSLTIKFLNMTNTSVLIMEINFTLMLFMLDIFQ